LDKYNSPCPGPCRNNRLIEWDPVESKFVGRRGLVMSSKNCAGDFRRASKETWLKFKEFYPESGPTITMVYNSTMASVEETYIGRHFVILDPPPAPQIKISESRKKKAQIAALIAAQEAAAAAKVAGSGSKDDDQISVLERSSSMSSSISVARPGPPPRTLSVADQFSQRAIELSKEKSASRISTVSSDPQPTSLRSASTPLQPMAPKKPTTIAPAPPVKKTSVSLYLFLLLGRIGFLFYFTSDL
jgi:hypothetical protein